MCGICGFTGEMAQASRTLQLMIQAIEHRGPDSAGVFSNRDISMGFRRLSIIDLENGQQPMHTSNGRFFMTFNGEIYNYRELQNTLKREGIGFRYKSDSETLLQLLAAYGEDRKNGVSSVFHETA